MATESATILASEMHLMTSHHTGRTYRITISLPLGYSRSPGDGWPFTDTPATWPVVYALDGNWCFGLVTDIVRQMAWCGRTTDAIVVGIGYPEAASPIATYREWSIRRIADLTPVRDEAVEQSLERQHQQHAAKYDAGNFHLFIQHEVIPFIEQTYRADPSRRVLVGHSYGGLFALFGLFATPELFDTLIVGSPSLSFGNRFTFQREEAFAQQHTKLPTNMFLYVGDLEEDPQDSTLTDTLRFAAILQGRNYEGCTVVKRVFHDQNHCEVAPIGFQAGLKFALKR
jgi:predicted alpha/beta superfamily hydrolase